MLAMALLLHGGSLLGGMGGEAAGVDGSGEGAWTLATPAEGFLAASGAGELAHLLHKVTVAGVVDKQKLKRLAGL
eukprot:COSAG02_NODE_76_length_41115_cov_60.967817_11_plen_75_part_00